MAITKAGAKKTLLGASALPSTTAVAKVMTNEDAQEEMNRQNVFRLVYIRAKKGMAKESTDKAVTNIMNTVLRHADGFRLKKVDEYQLHQLVNAVMEGAKRPDLIEI